MDRFTRAVTQHRVLIIVIFSVICVFCALLIGTVRVNYNMADYLPPGAQSTQAIGLMTAEFTGGLPNASVMVRDVSPVEALAYKEQLRAVPGVEEVLWLDDTVDLKQPLEMADTETVEGFYKDRNALFTVVIADESERPAVEEIREILGDRGIIAGTAADNVGMMTATGTEVGGALAILLPTILVILILSSRSWMDPLLYLLSIGSAIVINMGTNALLGEISFITNSVSPILQLAVSLDYSIFLLHSFDKQRQKLGDPVLAMQAAIKESASTVSASMLTTLCGFLALAFMNFQIGADLGLNLAKGILFSFLCTLVFLPAVTLVLCKLIDRTRHRPFLPSFSGIYKFFSKLAIPSVVIVAILIVPCFLGQARTQFAYGSVPMYNQAKSEEAAAQAEIDELFGSSTVMALLVPAGDVAREAELSRDLQDLPHVTSVVSYASMVEPQLPADFLGPDITGQFYSDNYARLVVYTDTDSEGDEAFQTVEDITKTANKYYDEVWSAGESANLYDMRTVVAQDNITVTLIAAAAIFVVLLITFRSALLPFILLLTIESAIWINLSIPYFTDTTINFIGYLVLNTVQLGATVDYAILLTTKYLSKRRLLPQHEAMAQAMGESFASILVSASVLSIAGFTLYATSSNPPVRDIGLLLGRGTVLSFIMVMCFLPAMLRLLDGAIAKTTYHADFYGDGPRRPRSRQPLEGHL